MVNDLLLGSPQRIAHASAPPPACADGVVGMQDLNEGLRSIVAERRHDGDGNINDARLQARCDRATPRETARKTAQKASDERINALCERGDASAKIF